MDLTDNNFGKIDLSGYLSVESAYNMFMILTSVQKVDLLNGQRYFFDIDGKKYMVIDGKYNKFAIGDDYNYIFDKINGKFMRWGKTYEDDPEYSPIGGEILDLEITTACNGVPNKNGVRSPCDFCYKSNTPNGKNMSFETFKNVFDKIGIQLTQVAFGADSQAISNLDLWKMMEYCRTKGVVPNITVADISDDVADKLVKYCGAVSVSRYSDKNVCYNSIKKLTDRGLKQVNMHYMICEESYDECLETLRDIKTDSRLAKLNAIVLLSLKRKGRGTKFTPLSSDKYNALVQYCLDNNMNFGMDSCGSKKFLDTVKDSPKYEQFKIVAEPCESSIFSQYLDVEGKFYPCSFCEEVSGWEEGIDVTKITNYIKELWYNNKVIDFRNKLTSNCNNCHKARECPIYEI